MTDDLLMYDAKKKRLGPAYFLWMMFGLIGAHRFYLGRHFVAEMQITWLVPGMLSLLMYAELFHWFPAWAYTPEYYQSMEYAGGVQLWQDIFSFALLIWGAITVAWMLYDLFAIPRIVTKFNTKLAESLSQ